MADQPLVVGDAILLGIVVVIVVIVLVLILTVDDVDGNDVVVVIDVGIDADVEVALRVVLVDSSGDMHTLHIFNYTAAHPLTNTLADLGCSLGLGKSPRIFYHSIKPTRLCC